MASWFLYDFMSYLEPLWSLFNWFSNKYKGAVGLKVILFIMFKVIFQYERGRGLREKVIFNDEGEGCNPKSCLT